MSRITHRERVRWIQTLNEDRAQWMKCRAGCAECDGYGWDVFNGQEIQRDDTCAAFEDDERAHDAAMAYLAHARRILEALAADQLSLIDAKLLAEALVGGATADEFKMRAASATA